MVPDDSHARRRGRSAVRLGFLLTLLGAVGAYGVPRIIADASAGTGAPICPPRPPLTARSGLAELEAFADRDGLYSLLGAGTTPDAYGLQEPAAAWLDNAPVRPTVASRRGAVDAGFELRWWSRYGDHLGASVFVFRDDAAAGEYLREAASTTCRSDAVARPVSWPPGARALIWGNPLGYLQTDILFARGRAVYRVADVAPDSKGRRPSRVDIGQLLAAPERLACELTYALCSGRSPELIALTWPRSRPSARRATLGSAE
jgi:hypothetical protein